MRKLFTSFLTLALASSISAAAFATTTNSATNTGSSGTNINVSGVYKNAMTTIISVDITWDSMDFTYFAAGSWNPTTHKGSSEGTWRWSGATGEQDSPKITVTNHSNTAVQATFAFAPNPDIKELTGSFTRVGNNNATYVQTATNTSPDSAPYTFAYFSITNGTINHDYDDPLTLGTITVTVSPYTAPDTDVTQ